MRPRTVPRRFLRGGVRRVRRVRHPPVRGFLRTTDFERSSASTMITWTNRDTIRAYFNRNENLDLRLFGSPRKRGFTVIWVSAKTWKKICARSSFHQNFDSCYLNFHENLNLSVVEFLRIRRSVVISVSTKMWIHFYLNFHENMDPWLF